MASKLHGFFVLSLVVQDTERTEALSAAVRSVIM
jgi:hypothetical protein